MQPWLRRLAVLATIVAALGGAAFLMLRSRDLSPGYADLLLFTDDASGLMDGTQVRLNGIAIGYLEAQKLTNSRDPMRKIELALKVKKSYLDQIPTDSVAGLAADNLLGDQFIAIHRGRSAQHIEERAELRNTQAQDIGKMMARMSQQLDRLNDIAARADKLLGGVTAGRGSAGKLVNDPKLKQGTVAAELAGLMGDVQHGHGTLTKLFYEDPLSAQTQGPLKRLDEVMATAGKSADQMKELTEGLTRAGNEFQALQADFAAGKGSFGKLDEFGRRADGLTMKWNAMLDRLNSGQGTAGQLQVNPQLNQALDGTMREFQELAKGLKTNPRKFIAIRLF